MSTRYRVVCLALGAFALLWALATALVRVGWEIPLPNYDMLIAHGPLMVCGFLGTLVGLERAVALDRPWAFTGPLLTGLGGVCQVFLPSEPWGAWLSTLGSLGLVIVFLGALRGHPALHTAGMGVGAAAWLAGNVIWSIGWPLFTAVPWWMAFLVVTIASERLELSRILFLGRAARALFLLPLALILLGAGLGAVGFALDRESQILSQEFADVFTSPRFDAGVRLFGLSAVGLSLWLLRFDIARRSLRQPGLPRYIAICLLTGYGWLAVSGLVGLTAGGIVGGLRYDAQIHALFLGFVFAMIFGHAPVILPAVLGSPVPFSRIFYAPLVLSHLSLLLRVAGDLCADPLGRKWGGLLNVAAILFFFVNTGLTAATARSPR